MPSKNRIRTSFAGTLNKDYSTSITHRQITNYTAALDDNNPIYFDDEQEAGIVAPPLFAAVITWPVAGRWDLYLENTQFPLGLVATQGVHYNEYLQIQRLIRAGDKISLKSRLVAIQTHPAGTLITHEYRALDATGQPVFKEFIGVLVRGVPCDGEDLGMGDLPVYPRSPTISSPKAQYPVKISPVLPYIYDGCTNIVFPIHTSVRSAHNVGLPNIILQGSATLGLAIKTLVNQEMNHDPRRISVISGQFSAFILPDSQIQVQLNEKIIKTDFTELYFEVFNQEKKPAIKHGYVQIHNKYRDI